MKKKITIIMALVLLLGLVGITLAWLTVQTAPITNTFTVGDISITLGETTTSYKMIPGHEIAKDPKVTVKANSEDALLFVKIVKANDFDNFMTYEPASGWTELTTGSGVYYRTVTSATADQEFGVLKDNKVLVKSAVTKTMLDALTVATYPKLTFTAYAHQLHKGDGNDFTPSEAWGLLSP